MGGKYGGLIQDTENRKRIDSILGNSQNIPSLLRGEIDTMKKKVSANLK